MKLYYEERLHRDTTIIEDDDVSDTYTYDSAMERKYGAFYQQHPLLANVEINKIYKKCTCTVHVGTHLILFSCSLLGYIQIA